MFFKNLKIYGFTKETSLGDSEALNIKLQEKLFQSCASTQYITHGWTSPLGNKSEQLVHCIGNKLMICLRQEEKILPASVVNEKLNEKLDAIEQEQGRRPVGKFKQSIKDDLILELLPKAFTKTSRTYAYIDIDTQMIIVDSSSNNKAEELIELLRQTLGSLPVVPLKTNTLPVLLMTSWLRGDNLKSDFTIKDECELRDMSEEGAIIRTKNEDLTSDEIRAHLDTGMEVTKLSVNWGDRIDFILNDDLSIKRLKFSDELLDQACEDSEDVISQFDADFNIMTGELSKFIARLVEAIDGEVK